MDRVGWVMWQRAAAWPKWRVSSSAMRNFSCLMSIFAPGCGKGADSIASGVIGRVGIAGDSRGLGFGVWNPKPQGECTMSLLSFVKEAGEKLLDLLTPGNANASEQLK